MLFFLGGGFGPALTGAFLQARRENAGEALNPLYTLDAAHFSDTFLLLALCIHAALLAAALRPKPHRVPDAESRRTDAQPDTRRPGRPARSNPP